MRPEQTTIVIVRIRTSIFGAPRALLLGTLVALAAQGLAAAQITTVGDGGPGPVKAQHLTAELVSLGPAIVPGGQQMVGLVLTMEEHWHVYWVNPGDAGEPPKIEWTMPPGFNAGAMQFPIPEKLPVGPLMDFGYDYEVALPVPISAPASAKPGPAHLDAQVSWLVCSEVCLPGKAHLGLDLNVQPGAPALSQEPRLGALGEAMGLLPRALPSGAKASMTGDATRFALTLNGIKRATDADFFPYVDTSTSDAAPPSVIANAAVQGVEPLKDGLRIFVKRAPDLTTLPAKLSGIVRLSDSLAYEVSAPVIQVNDVWAASHGGRPAPPPGANATSMTAWGAIGLAFVGGIILNLMPCVFPVLFLKGLALVQTANAPEGSASEGHALRHGLVYTLGILVSFWALVAVLIALRAGGTHVGWGFQLQSPVFLAILSTAMFFLALSLAGQFDIGLSLTSVGGGLAQKQGYAGSFFTGVLATVVATPCSAWLMGAAVGFALAQPAVISFAVFTALALGLATPYLLLSWRPAWAKLLPKPGAWMEVLKQLTAVPLFATAIWLAWVYGQIETARAGGDGGVTQIALLLACFLLVAIAGWALGRWPAKWGSAIAAVALIAIGLAIPLSQQKKIAAEAASNNAAATAANSPGGANSAANLDMAWQPYSEQALQAAHAAGRPVFIDFTAAWCLSCQVNERIALKTAEVEAALRKGNFVTMKADWTDYGPVIEQKLQSLGRDSVPTYAIYPAAPGSAPDVLPELLSKQIVLNAIGRDTK